MEQLKVGDKAVIKKEVTWAYFLNSGYNRTKEQVKKMIKELKTPTKIKYVGYSDIEIGDHWVPKTYLKRANLLKDIIRIKKGGDNDKRTSHVKKEKAKRTNNR